MEDVSSLSNAQLISDLEGLLLARHKLTAKILVHLAEVDKRKLYLEHACSSMHVYCRDRLHMSDARAYRHIRVARAVREFPLILRFVDTGEIHLSALCELVPHLTQDNHRRLLQAARYQTKDAVRLLVAKEFPKPDVPVTVRKLPQRKVEMPMSGMSTTSPTTSTTTTTSTRGKAAAKLEPLSPARYKLQVTLGQEVVEKLQAAKDLLRHRNPNVDTEAVLEMALGDLVEKLEKQKYALTSKPKEASRPQRSPDTKKNRHIPHAIKRKVAARDRKQCAYRDSTGRRCQAKSWLEFHHRWAFGKGGEHRADNIELRCRAHNMMAAENDYGTACIQRHINSRQRELGKSNGAKQLTLA